MHTIDSSISGLPATSDVEISAGDGPVRVMKVMTLFGIGGTEGQVVNLVKGMDRSRFDIEFACLHKRGEYLKDLEELAVPVSEFPASSLMNPGIVRRMWALARHMRKRRVQVVHTYNFYANVFALPAARLAGVPVILASVRDQGIYLSKSQCFAQRQALRCADRILVNAHTIRNWLMLQGVPDDRIVLQPNGIDMARYVNVQPSGIRAELKLADDAPLVVMVTRLVPHKGVDDFIRAAYRVADQVPKAQFVVVGEKPDSSGSHGAFHRELQQLISDLGLQHRIHFTGFRRDVPEILAEADVSVLPSHSEGTSNTVLEAMAAGVPVVSSWVGGSAELLDYGKCGILVPPHQWDQVGDGIARLLGDAELARRMGEAGRKRAAEHYSLENMVRQTEQFYLAQLSRELRRKA